MDRMNDMLVKVRKCPEQLQNNGCLKRVREPTERDPKSQSWHKLSNKIKYYWSPGYKINNQVSMSPHWC